MTTIRFHIHDAQITLMTTDAIQSETPSAMTQLKAGLRRWLPSWQFLRYLLVGVWNTAFGYMTYAALTWVLSRHVAYGYLCAAVLSNFIAISVAFLGYKWLVFKTHGNYLREWMRCFVVYGAVALPGLLLLPVVVNALIYIFHFSLGGKTGAAAPFQLTAAYMGSTFLTAPYIGGAILTAGTVIFSFFGHRHFSFRPCETGNTEANQTGKQNSVRD
jgi:putative flippase GtrA